jgi:hypothetical protein
MVYLEIRECEKPQFLKYQKWCFPRDDEKSGKQASSWLSDQTRADIVFCQEMKDSLKFIWYAQYFFSFPRSLNHKIKNKKLAKILGKVTNCINIIWNKGDCPIGTGWNFFYIFKAPHYDIIYSSIIYCFWTNPQFLFVFLWKHWDFRME